MIIYFVKNKVNGKMYIGQSIHPLDGCKSRVRYHLRGKGSKLVSLALSKYGQDNFTYGILYELDSRNQDLLDELEISNIDYFKTITPRGYNMIPGGNGHGRQVTLETRLKHSRNKTGKWSLINKTPEERIEIYKKIADSQRGHNNLEGLSEERLKERNKKISDFGKIFHNTPEMKKWHSDHAKGKNPWSKKTLEEVLLIKEKMSRSKKGKNKGVYSCANKTQKEMTIIREKMSNSAKLAATRPHILEQNSEKGILSSHRRRHAKRKIVSLTCKYCFS